MNPPFSSSGGRAKNNDSNFGFRHVKAALARLKNGGRLVALLGSDTLTKTDIGRGFLSELATEYELKAVINLPKNAFYKYGTTVQTSIICIRYCDSNGEISHDVGLTCLYLYNFITILTNSSGLYLRKW